MQKLILKNCLLYNSQSRDLNDIMITGGKISDIAKTGDTFGETLDVNGRIICPGFIDIHIQGAGGADILDATPEALSAISKTLAQYGTTSFLATTVFHTQADNTHIQLAAEYTGKNLEGAQILGIHLEGPFINPVKKGGIAPSCIAPSSKKIYDQIMDLTGSTLKMMTIAPELEGNIELIKKYVDYGIIASFGHSNANYEKTLLGIEAGISHVTHFFNTMPPIHHRNPGPVPAILESDHVSVQIIADGVHLHPSIVKLINRVIGNERCICITDGIQALGLPEGNYIYNGKEYYASNGTARYLDGTLIGTSISLDQIYQRFKNYTNCSFESAINTVTENPATILGIFDRKGSISIGKDADLVILDSDLSVWATIISGNIVYKKS